MTRHRTPPDWLWPVSPQLWKYDRKAHARRRAQLRRLRETTPRLTPVPYDPLALRRSFQAAIDGMERGEYCLRPVVLSTLRRWIREEPPEQLELPL